MGDLAAGTHGSRGGFGACSKLAFAVTAAVALTAGAARDAARAEVQVGDSRVRAIGRGVETLKFELHAVNDDVTLYAGGPRELLVLEVRPRSMPPRVDMTSGRNPTLRVRDLSLYDAQVTDDPLYLDDEYPEDTPVEQVPESQSWEAQLTALVPTDFFFDIEKGSGDLDLTDMHVRNLHILSHLAEIKLEFSRPNDGELERLQLNVDGGRLELLEFLNARPRSATIQMDETECDVQITGKPFEGSAEIYFTGVPDGMRFEVSRKIGVRIEGPPNTVARFDHDGMERRGLALYSTDYEGQSCKVLLHFAEDIHDIEVDWD